MKIIYENYSDHDWYNHAKFLYEIILNEIENSIVDQTPENYPKAVIAYEFFRMLRSEWFNSSRPPEISQDTLQKDIYQMENKLYEKLEMLRKIVNSEDERINFYIEDMKKSFDIPN